MKIILDTHTFIWWDSQPEKLSPKALELLTDSNNQRLLSVASIWEMQIKAQLGKLKLTSSLKDIVESQQRINKIQLLDVRDKHVFALDSLPLYHKDPFDRILIAQANVENAVLISRDPVFPNYPVKLIW